MTFITDQRFRQLVAWRASSPELIAEKSDDRRRRRLPGENERLVVIAADHPARRILGVGSDPQAMGDRRGLLERLLRALRRPGVDGVLATPDIIEDLLLLDEIHDKLTFGSMNRGGLTGSVWELDDRFTAYDPDSIERFRLEGGKMLLRLDYSDPGTNLTIEACARAVSALAARRLIAMVEPLPARRNPEGKVVISDEIDALVEAVAVASGLGNTSAYTWLKLPASDDPERMMSATTLPALLLGGDPGDRGGELLRSWKRAMAIPNVRGLVAGRSLLYPADGEVERWVDAAVEVVHG